MFAVIKSGGKQHMARAGKFIITERLEGEVGSSIIFSGTDVLFVDHEGLSNEALGINHGVKVSATIVEHKRNKTIIVFKKKRRKNYRRKNGHRQLISVLQINEITI